MIYSHFNPYYLKIQEENTHETIPLLLFLLYSGNYSAKINIYRGELGNIEMLIRLFSRAAARAPSHRTGPVLGYHLTGVSNVPSLKTLNFRGSPRLRPPDEPDVQTQPLRKSSETILITHFQFHPVRCSSCAPFTVSPVSGALPSHSESTRVFSYFLICRAREGRCMSHQVMSEKAFSGKFVFISPPIWEDFVRNFT